MYSMYSRYAPREALFSNEDLEAKLERAKMARHATLRSGQARHALYACRPH